jgi:ABC-type transport system substrate-binding protein
MRLRRAAVAAVPLATCAGCLSVQRDPPPRPVAAVADAQTGGTLTVGIATPTSIDPALVPPSDEAGSLVVRTMCDALMSMSPTTGRLVPDLVSGVQLGGDGTVLTLQLRRGLRFSDGSRLTATDVVASLTRLVRPEVASPNAALLDRVLGARELQQGDDSAHGRLAGVTATDPRTVQIALRQPAAGFVRTLAATALTPVPHRYGHDNGFGRFSTQPVCVGPYRLAAPWHPGDATITLVRADGYDGGNPGDTRAGRGWVDRIVFRVYPDVASAYAGYLRGEVDIAPVPASSATVAGRRLGGALVSAPDATLGYVGLPTTVPPYDDPVVRTALSMAVDRAAIVAAVYGGGRTPAQGLYPPVVGDATWRAAACGASAPLHADVAAARRLLGARLRQLRAKPMALYYDDEFANKALMAAVGRQWHAAFGVDVQLVGSAFGDYLPKAMQAPGLPGPFRLSYASSAASPDDYVRDLLTSAAIDTSNATRFTDQRVERLYADVASRRFGAGADSAWRDVEQRFCAAMPLVPLTFNDRLWAWRDTVAAADGTRLDRATALPLLREAFRR